MSAKRLQNECEKYTELYTQRNALNAEIRRLEQMDGEVRTALDELRNQSRATTLLHETIHVLHLSPSVRTICYKADLVLLYKIQHCINTGEWPTGVGAKTQAELTTELDKFWKAHGL